MTTLSFTIALTELVFVFVFLFKSFSITEIFFFFLLVSVATLLHLRGERVKGRGGMTREKRCRTGLGIDT